MDTHHLHLSTTREARAEALYTELSALTAVDDAVGLRALLAAHDDAIIISALPPLRGLLRITLRAAMHDGAFACLRFVLDDGEVVDLTDALESVADMDYPNAKMISDEWVNRVALTVRMVRERLPRDWDLRPARRLARERHAWATWISLDPINPPNNWLAILLDSVGGGFWTDPSHHDVYWCVFFARRADDDALADCIRRAAARPALLALLEGEADRRRREMALAFALGSVRRLMPAPGAARGVFDNADLIDMINRRVVG